MLDVLDWIVRSALRWFSHRDNRFRAVGRVVLGITTLSLCLSGCAMSVPFSTQDRQIIVMWHAFTGSNARALQTLTDRFNAENSWNIVLVTEYQEQLLDKLLADPDSRPDLVTLWPEELQTYVALGIAGAAPTLSPEMQVAWDDVLPMARALYEVDGQAKALPLGLATYLAYYNEEWLSELGYDATTATWEDFRRTVCAATDPLRGRVGVGVPARASVLLAFLAASGSELVDAAGYYQFADEEGYASASYLQAVMTGDCGEVYENWDRGLSELSKSSMAMIVESSERLSDIEEGILAGRNFPLGLSPLPGVAGPGATVWYGPGLMVSAPPGARQEAALNVLQWFFAPEAQTIWGELTEYIPVQRSVVEAAVDDSGPEFLLSSEAQLWQLALDAADNETWFSWPLATNRITCRASLLRGLLALQQETADAGAYIDTAVTACNTGVGFRPIPTPTATEEASP